MRKAKNPLPRSRKTSSGRVSSREPIGGQEAPARLAGRSRLTGGALHESQQRFSAIFNQVTSGIAQVDLTGRFLLVNRAYCDILGRTEEQLLQLKIQEITHPEDLPANLIRFSRLAEGGPPFSIEERYVRPDGSPLWVRNSVSLMRDQQGMPQYIVSVTQEITERERPKSAFQESEARFRTMADAAPEALERQAERFASPSHELAHLVHTAVHELREPLLVIALYCQMLQREYQGKLGADADQFIQYVVEGVGRMETLLDDLQSYSRVSKVLDVPPELVECDAVIQEVLSNLGAAIGETGAVITCGALPSVRAHRAHLVQLLQHLLGNALKFRTEEPPKVVVRAERDRNEWRFSVKDHGIGIDPQYAAQVFGIFKRLHGFKYPGTGMGLAICSRVVDRYGGRIWVESELNRGSTFFFTLPVAPDSAASHQATPAETTPPTRPDTAPKLRS